MAEKKPLCVYAGNIKELQSGDTLKAGGELTLSPASDHGYSGDWGTITVDVNAEGIGAPLFMAADGNLETADATNDTKMPCIALALETGTGSKKVLFRGIMRDDSWNWTSFGAVSGLIFISTTTGVLTQTAPSANNEMVQVVGFAMHADRMFFNPCLAMVKVSI